MLAGILSAVIAAGAAQVPPPAPPGTQPVTYRPAVVQPAQSDRPFAFVLGMGMDRGSDEVGGVLMSDGSTQMLRANSGFSFFGGLSFLKHAAGTVAFDTLATVGVKGWNVGADNGSISYLGFPVDVVERLWVQQARFGLGLTYVLAPKFSSSGVASNFGEYELENALGVVVQAEWIGPRTGRAGFFVGARAVFQKLEPKLGTGSLDANSIGFTLGFEL